MAATKYCAIAALLCGCWAAVPSDEVHSLPGLDGPLSSRLYSGYIKAQAANQTFYTHYLLTEAQSNQSAAPLVLWQQGGPGSSGMGFGWLAELGPYTLNAASLGPNKTGTPRVFRNPHSFDSVANLLIFEHPPGTGFSYCADEHDQPTACKWNDQTQAEAFQNTLEAWLNAYSEYAGKPLHMIGESYAGLLLPHLVERLIKHPGATATPPTQLAIGNGCPGTAGATPEKPGTCNGPYGDYDTQHVFELIAGHGGVSRALVEAVNKACGFPCTAPTWSEDCMTYSTECNELLQQVDAENGPFNIYNYYDNCGTNNQVMSWREHMQAGRAPNPTVAPPIRRTFTLPDQRLSGGQAYACGTGAAALAWGNLPEVRKALHMKPESFYQRKWSLQAGPGMVYSTYTGSSYDLYPSILEQLPVTIYNGDVDACVPYNSNEDWVTALAAQQGYSKAEAWRPWLLDKVPAGYVSSYATSHHNNLTFITIKDSGHMVPQYQPERAFAFFTRWLTNTRF